MVGDACALLPPSLACLVTPHAMGIKLTPRRINVLVYHLVCLLCGFGRYLVRILGSRVAKILFQCLQLAVDHVPDLQDLIFSQ